MYKHEIWESIREKHRHFHQNLGPNDDVENVFLNSLNEQEYAEFVRNKPSDQSIDKYMKSGMASELLQPGKEREKVGYQRRELDLLEQTRVRENED